MAFLVTEEMRELATVAARQGLGNGVDFYIRGLPFSGQLGSDLIGLSYDGQQYTVEHRRADRTVELQRSADFGDSARRFLDEASRIASSYAPRREHRPDPEPEAAPAGGAAWLYLQLFGLGLIIGILIIPVLVVAAVLALGNTGLGNGGRPRKPRARRSWRDRIGGDWLTALVFGFGLLVGVVAVGTAGLIVLGR